MLFMHFVSDKCYGSRDKMFLYNLKKGERRDFFPMNEKHVPVSLLHSGRFAVFAPARLC